MDYDPDEIAADLAEREEYVARLAAESAERDARQLEAKGQSDSFDPGSLGQPAADGEWVPDTREQPEQKYANDPTPAPLASQQEWVADSRASANAVDQDYPQLTPAPLVVERRCEKCGRTL